jgi:Uma2 family endonuclease
MATVALKIGPDDHGRPLTVDEHASGTYEPGYRYELIDGRLYVSPEANLPEYCLEDWLFDRLKAYARKRPGVINFVTNKARVFVKRPTATTPEPDIAAYRGFPKNRPFRNMDWRKISPLLVVEVPSEDDPDKDLVRNVELYFQVASIKEYWIIDGREDPDRPRMIVHRRQGGRWQVLEVAFGATYTTRLLPGFKLVLDPHS